MSKFSVMTKPVEISGEITLGLTLKKSTSQISRY